MRLFPRRLHSNRSAFLNRFTPSLEILEGRTLLAANLTQFNLVSPDKLNANSDTFGTSVVVLVRRFTVRLIPVADRRT